MYFGSFLTPQKSYGLQLYICFDHLISMKREVAGSIYNILQNNTSQHFFSQLKKMAYQKWLLLCRKEKRNQKQLRLTFEYKSSQYETLKYCKL